MQLSVCHKCGGVREIFLPAAVKDYPGEALFEEAKLIRCRCISQTIFSFETRRRSIKEAQAIQHGSYVQTVRLYCSQGRDDNEFYELAVAYKEKAVRMPIIYDEEWEEWIVQWWEDGVMNEDKTYHTSGDKAEALIDAEGTRKMSRIRLAENGE